MPPPHLGRCITLAAVLLTATACLDREAPFAADTDLPELEPSFSTTVSCVADVRSASVACARPSGGGDQARIIGGQGRYVQLTSSSIEVDGNVFSFDVTLQNLIHQAMGTTDGVTPHADGIRVFFSLEPRATSGSGSIVVGNADGTTAYMESERPYYQYAGLLPHNETSAARNWEFVFDEEVETFEFAVLIATEVQHTDNWIDLSGNRSYFTNIGGDSATLTGVIRDPLGNEVDGAISWSTADPEIASIDAGGFLSAGMPGFTTITATSGAATGEWTVGVCRYMGPASLGTSDREPDESERFCLASGDSVAEYVVIPVNTSQDAALQVTTLAAGIGPAVGPPTPALSPSHPSFLRAGSPTTAGFHSRGAVRSSSGRGLTPRGPAYAIVPGTPTVGDQWDLTVASDCSEPDAIRTGAVSHVGEHAIIVVDTLNEVGLNYDSIFSSIESLAAPVVYHNFNHIGEGTYDAPADIDENGAVVYFFSTAVTDQLAPGSGGGFGYFAPRDLDPTAECATSNSGEIIYLAAPNGTVSVDDVNSNLGRTIAHELQHLVNRSYRNQEGLEPEEGWLDEAMSHVAEELTLYATTGLSPRAGLGATSFTAPARYGPFFRLLNPSFERLQSWLMEPNAAGVVGTAAPDASRGAGWAFLRYYIDQAREANQQPAFTTSLVQTPETGIAKLENLASPTIADQLVDFATAMYVDDNDSLPGLEDRLETHSWNFRSMYEAGAGGSFPLAPIALADGEPVTRTYAPGGGAAYLRFGVAAGGFVDISNSTAGGDPIPSSMRFRVVRTR